MSRSEAKLESFEQRALAAFGLAIGVVRFSVRSSATGEPVTPRSLFHVASISKPFVATTIVQLVKRERCDVPRRGAGAAGGPAHHHSRRRA